MERATSRWVTRPTTRSPSITREPGPWWRHMTATGLLERDVDVERHHVGRLGELARLTSRGSRPLATTWATMSRLLTTPARLPSVRHSGTASSLLGGQEAAASATVSRGPEDLDVLRA